MGPVIWANEKLLVSHRPVDENGMGFPGYVFVESRRHAASLDELTPSEVEAIAHAAWHAARGLRAELDPLFVFSAIAGRSVAHFHQHVFARHRDTPDDINWTDGHLWAGAPRASSSDVAELCTRLKRYFA